MAKVTTAPTANTLTYNGSQQALVKAGTATGGTMQYALGKNGETAPALNKFTADAPKGTDAGDYYVWYRIAGDANHNDVAPACVKATIAKASVTVTAAAQGLDSDAQIAQYLDLSVYKKVGNDAPQKVIELPQNIKARITIPEDKRREGRVFFIVRVHDGKAEIIARGTGEWIECDTNLFSTYALGYVDSAPAASPAGIPILTITSAGSDALNFALTNVSGVDGFDIFLTECGNKGEFPLLTSIDGLNATLSGFKVGEAYKAYAQPWVMVNGVKTSVLGATLVFHCFTNDGNKKMTNPGSLKLKKDALAIRLGKTARLKGSVKGVKKGNLINHDAKLRFISSNPAVVTVSAKGKATITVATANGKKAKVKIKVE